MAGPIVFDLTRLLSGAAAERRAVFKTVDLPRRTWGALAVGAVLGIGVYGFAAGIFSLIGFSRTYAVIPFAAMVAATVALFRGRSSSGLRLLYWQMIRDRMRNRSRTGRFFLRGQEVDPMEGRWVLARRRYLMDGHVEPERHAALPRPVAEPDDWIDTSDDTPWLAADTQSGWALATVNDPKPGVTLQ